MITSKLREQINSTVQQFLTRAQIPGAAVAIRIDGQAALDAGIGYRDAPHRVPLSADARFYLYSITKPLIAMAVLHQVQDGQLDLDAPLQLDRFNLLSETAITLRQLLSHTSGLPDYGGVPAYAEAVKTHPGAPWSIEMWVWAAIARARQEVKTHPGAPWSIEMFLNLAATQGLQFPPGEGWAYSNIGYLWLRRILEQTTGLSLPQLLKQIIFSPLALQKTFVPITLEDGGELTPGYTSCFGSSDLQDISRIYHPGWVAHGVVISTASELATIIDALFRGQILDRSRVEQMARPVYTLGQYPLFTNLSYGLGLFVDTESPYGTASGHTGEGPGYSVAAFHFPELANSAITITALVNRDHHDAGLVAVYKVARVIAEHS